MKILISIILILSYQALSATQLVNEEFTNNINDWSVSNHNKVYHSSAYGGSMFIDKGDRGYRTYPFGAGYANQNLDVEIKWCATQQWESNRDYLRIKVNNSVAKTDYNSGGCKTLTFSKNADSRGRFKIDFSPRTSSNDEDAYIKSLTIDGSPLSEKYNCPGEVITDLEQTVTSVSSDDEGSIEAYATYYYNFTPAVNGTIQVDSYIRASANSLYIKDGCNSDLWSDTHNSNSKESPEIEVSASEQIVIALQRRQNSRKDFNLEFNFVANIPKADLVLFENILPNPDNADINEDINISISAENIGVADADANIVLLASYNQDVNITLATEIDANNFNCTPNSGLLSSGSTINCTMTSPFITGATTKKFTFVVRATSLGELIQTSVISSQTDDLNITNNTLQSTTVEIRTPGYCESHALEQGYHIIDPDGGDYINSFEIYCDRSDPSDIKDVLKLPMSNEMNTAEFSNFTFNSSIPDRNYYNSSHAKTSINYIRINAYTLEVIADNSNGFFNGDFSSLNLRGTPFTFDWENLSNNDIQGCDLALMRLDYDSNNQSGGQTLKINPKLENVHKCSSSSLKIKFLDQYKYIKYLSNEVLESSCKSMSSVLPDVGDFTSITGYYYIDPKESGREANQNLSEYRPFVTYCMEVAGDNPEDEFSWTMFLTLDGKRTDHHDDIENARDTCSNLGLIFYVPNSQTTFNKVKDFLYGQKNQWKEYTGKMDEYFTDRDISGWGAENETDRDYWPYGPMGLYYDDGPASDWNPTIKNGRWINGIKYGYDLTSSSSIDGTSINIAHLSNGNGWTTTLEDLNISDDFWITDLSAGNYNNSAGACGGGSTNKCYLDGSPSPEPNGDYDRGNWMHFWADDNGDIYHYNDQNGNRKYIHDHYMCIAPDNYQVLYRFGLTEGPFSVIEGSQTIVDGASIDTLNLPITTKIVKEPLDFDIVIFDTGMNTIDKDQNISAGLFLTYTEIDADTGNEIPLDIHNFGVIGGANPTIDTSLGYANLSSNLWSNNSNIIDSAYKRLFFQFKYCSEDDKEWTYCWDASSNTAICNQGCSANEENCLCKTSESDDFAARPDRFSINANGLTYVKAEDINLSYYAYNFVSEATYNYNESLSGNIEINTSIADSSKTCVNSNLILNNPTQFSNGENHSLTTFSDVGTWLIDIHEIDGLEYAIIDASDTPDSDRFITPSSTTLSVLPHHFSITPITQLNVLGNYTYLSNDLENMGLLFDFNISAKNHSDAITQNYSSDCYANNINLAIKYSVSNGNMPSKIVYKELISSIDGNNTATNNLLSLPKNIGDTLPSTLFTNTNNGVAELQVRANFQRDKSNSLNPFVVNFNDINVSDQTTPLVISNDDTHTINLDAKMLYGRTNAPRHRFKGNSGTAFINYEVFCNSTDTSNTSCDKTLLPDGPSSKFSDDSRWFINTSHEISAGVIGDITKKGSGNDVTSTSVTNSNPAQSTLTYNSFATKGYPYKTTMENNASSWLIYNKYNINDITNEFEVEFDSTGTWVGQHETDTTTNTSATSITNRRTMW